MSVIILDYGLGNLRSLSWALERIGCVHSISSDKKVIESSQKLIIPGVGSFGEARKNLDSLDLTDFIRFYAKKSSNKIFGICLGMQLLFEGSEESPGVLGLSVLKGFYKKLDAETSHVPHMGWNNLEPLKTGSDFSYLSEIKKDADFYFVHSYGLLDTTLKNHLKSLRGNQNFVSYIEHQNLTCTQFHPEKSHRQGLTLLKNWVNS
mgnify:CR=1 FL=1